MIEVLTKFPPIIKDTGTSEQVEKFSKSERLASYT